MAKRNKGKEVEETEVTVVDTSVGPMDIGKFLKEQIKSIDNEYASIVEDGVKTGDITGWTDTGSYSLNALISGSMFLGTPNGRVTCFAGKESVGKTFYAVSIVKHFLESDPNTAVIYFESEGSVSKKLFKERNVDTSRVMIVPVVTIEEFCTQALKILGNLEKIPEKKRPKTMFILDSLGNVSTNHEIKTLESGDHKKDLTRNAVIKGTFRSITLVLSKLQIPFILVTHTYATMDQYNPDEMSGGSGTKYAASSIIFLYKRKERTDGEITGNNVRCKIVKSRLTKEFQEVESLINYSGGLDRYHGLVEIGVESKFFRNLSNKIEVPIEFVYGVQDLEAVTSELSSRKITVGKTVEESDPFGTNVIIYDNDAKDPKPVAIFVPRNNTLRIVKRYFESVIRKTPEKYFTPQVLSAMDEYVTNTFAYAPIKDGIVPENEEVEDESAEI